MGFQASNNYMPRILPVIDPRAMSRMPGIARQSAKPGLLTMFPCSFTALRPAHLLNLLHLHTEQTTLFKDLQDLRIHSLRVSVKITQLCTGLTI